VPFYVLAQLDQNGPTLRSKNRDMRPRGGLNVRNRFSAFLNDRHTALRRRDSHEFEHIRRNFQPISRTVSRCCKLVFVQKLRTLSEILLLTINEGFPFAASDPTRANNNTHHSVSVIPRKAKSFSARFSDFFRLLPEQGNKQTDRQPNTNTPEHNEKSVFAPVIHCGRRTVVSVFAVEMPNVDISDDDKRYQHQQASSIQKSWKLRLLLNQIGKQDK